MCIISFFLYFILLLISFFHFFIHFFTLSFLSLHSHICFVIRLFSSYTSSFRLPSPLPLLLSLSLPSLYLSLALSLIAFHCFYCSTLAGSCPSVSFSLSPLIVLIFPSLLSPLSLSPSPYANRTQGNRLPNPAENTTSRQLRILVRFCSLPRTLFTLVTPPAPCRDAN